MSRLTARTQNGHAYLAGVKPNEQEVNSPYRNTLQCIMDCFERLAHYEDLEEQGRLLELIQQEESGGWISVEDGLPEESDLVLAIASGKPRPNITFHDAYVFASYSAAEGWIVEEYPDWEDAEITHWQPLPEPPKRGDVE